MSNFSKEMEYKRRKEDFSRKLKELLEDYHVRIYVYTDDCDSYYVNTDTLGCYSEEEFDFDFKQPVRDSI